MDPAQPCAAFDGARRIAAGPLDEVAAVARSLVQAGRPVLVFDDETGRVIDLDPRGATEPARRPGRPRLGVAAREVTLLPRHWDWLGRQSGGASAALRRLVETAMRQDAGPERRRLAQEAVYRFATAMAGDAPGYEEAMRALFAGDRGGFETLTATWPADVGEHARRLAVAAFAPETA